MYIDKELIRKKLTILDRHLTTIEDMDFDEAVFATFKNRKQLDEYIKEIGKQKFILRTNTHLILRTVKEKAIKIW